jgi:hypothetical protein
MKSFTVVVPTLALFALLGGGCASANFTPYQGAQQQWPTAPGGFVETKHAVPVYYGPPPRPYDVLGHIDATTAPVRRHDVVPYAASQAKERGGDAIIVMQEGTEYAGTWMNGNARTSGTVSGNRFDGNTSYQSTATPMFKGKASVLVIKFKP